MRRIVTVITALVALATPAWAEQAPPADPKVELSVCVQFANDVKTKRDQMEVELARLRAEVQRLQPKPAEPSK